MAPPHLPAEQPYVAGHIPGATNIPWSQAANEDGTFRSADELLALYTNAGIIPGEEVITYCRIGERSSHTWFVLSELLGFPRVANYDGSWTEYGSLVAVPVETGKAA
jgi:thiosulfate/3-mercaptopyruvate sulfurtransferase